MHQSPGHRLRHSQPSGYPCYQVLQRNRSGNLRQHLLSCPEKLHYPWSTSFRWAIPDKSCRFSRDQQTSSVATISASSYAVKSTAAPVSPMSEISSVSYATRPNMPPLSLASESSTPAYAPKSTPASKAALSAAKSLDLKKVTTLEYLVKSIVPEETCGTSTTTKYTTITLTTTVMAGSTRKDASLISSPTAVLPTADAETSPTASETLDYSSSTSVGSSLSATRLMPSILAVPSSNGTTYIPPVPSAVESAATPSASVAPANSYPGVPSGMTKQQFKQWFKECLAKYFGTKGNGRNHPRDLVL